MCLFYQIETQAWMIHWKTTNMVVHRIKYANRNMGNLCICTSTENGCQISADNPRINMNYSKVKSKLTKRFNEVSPRRKIALMECMQTINWKTEVKLYSDERKQYILYALKEQNFVAYLTSLEPDWLDH